MRVPSLTQSAVAPRAPGGATKLYPDTRTALITCPHKMAAWASRFLTLPLHMGSCLLAVVCCSILEPAAKSGLQRQMISTTQCQIDRGVGKTNAQTEGSDYAALACSDMPNNTSEQVTMIWMWQLNAWQEGIQRQHAVVCAMFKVTSNARAQRH